MERSDLSLSFMSLFLAYHLRGHFLAVVLFRLQQSVGAGRPRHNITILYHHLMKLLDDTIREFLFCYFLDKNDVPRSVIYVFVVHFWTFGLKNININININIFTNVMGPICVGPGSFYVVRVI